MGHSLPNIIIFRSQQASLEGRARPYTLNVRLAASPNYAEQAGPLFSTILSSYIPRIAALPLIKIALGALISPFQCSLLVMIPFAPIKYNRSYTD